MIGKPISAALIFLAACSGAAAQNCRDLPPGPAKFECASRNHPGLTAKLEHCQEEARQMGLTKSHGSGMREFVQACMHRK
jgi:hypothetical protein